MNKSHLKIGKTKYYDFMSLEKDSDCKRAIFEHVKVRIHAFPLGFALFCLSPSYLFPSLLYIVHCIRPHQSPNFIMLTHLISFHPKHSVISYFTFNLPLFIFLSIIMLHLPSPTQLSNFLHFLPILVSINIKSFSPLVVFRIEFSVLITFFLLAPFHR